MTRRAQRTTTVAVIVALALFVNWLPAPDAAANDYLADAMAGNLVIYASARALNGIISVIQSIEVGFSIGAGVAVNLGEVLDPLNDMIERFSSFVLVALAALGVQKVVLLATSSFAMKCITTLAIIAAAAATWFGALHQRWIVRGAAAIVLARFFLLVEVGVVAALDAVYLDEQSLQAHEALQVAREDLGDLREQYLEAARVDGIFSGAIDTVMRIVGNEQHEGIADQAAGAVVELIVVMLIRTLLVPLLFVWLFVAGTRRLLLPVAA